MAPATYPGLSITGCGWEEYAVAFAVNVIDAEVTHALDKASMFARHVRCAESCTTVERSRIYSLEVCKRKGKYTSTSYMHTFTAAD